MTTKTKHTAPAVAILAAAGLGTRLGAGLPKAYVQLGECTLLERSVAGLLASPRVEHVVVVIAPDMQRQAEELLVRYLDGERPQASLVHGGAERADSVWCGLQYARQHYAPEIVLVHDAARALTPPAMTDRVIDGVLKGHEAVIPVLPVTDTIKEVRDDRVVGTPVRANLRAVQTPQGFAAQALYTANTQYFSQRPSFVATDDASLMEWAGHQVHCVLGDAHAMKITTPIDLAVARLLLQEESRSS